MAAVYLEFFCRNKIMQLYCYLCVNIKHIFMEILKKMYGSLSFILSPLSSPSWGKDLSVLHATTQYLSPMCFNYLSCIFPFGIYIEK